MAIRYDPRLYTAGTAVFNPEPITMASEYVSRVKQAKNDALDQYYQKRGDSINGAGMRNQDLGDFQKKISDLKDYYLVNKDRLRKGDIMAQSNYEKIFRDAQGIVAKSKNKTEIGDKLFEISKMQRNEGGAPTQELMDAIKINDLPISHKESRDVDPNYFMGEPKPFDLGKSLKTYEDVPRTMGMPKVGETDPKTGKRLITETEVFDDNAKNTIALRAGSEYQNNRSFQREVNRATSDPIAKKQLEEVYQNQFGEAPKESHDYATAYILSQKQLTKTNQKLEDDKEWARERDRKDKVAMENMRQRGRIALEGIKQGNRQGLLKARAALKGASKQEEDNALDTIFGDLETESKKPGHKWETVSNGKKTGDYQVAPISPTIKKLFAQEVVDADGKKSKIEPTHIGFNKDGTVKVIYTTGGEGDRFAIDKKLSHDISKNEFKAMIGKGLGLGVKITGEAKYAEQDDNEDEEEQIDFAPTQPAKKSTGSWRDRAKKIK